MIPLGQDLTYKNSHHALIKNCKHVTVVSFLGRNKNQKVWMLINRLPVNVKKYTDHSYTRMKGKIQFFSALTVKSSREFLGKLWENSRYSK